MVNSGAQNGKAVPISDKTLMLSTDKSVKRMFRNGQPVRDESPYHCCDESMFSPDIILSGHQKLYHN